MARIGPKMIARGRSFAIAALTVLCLMMPGQVLAQHYPVEFLRAMAMRNEPAAPAIPAVEHYAAAVQTLDPQSREDIDTALAEARAAQVAGDERTAQARLARARVMLDGGTWNDDVAFARSITLTSASPFITSGETSMLSINRLYNAPFRPATIRLSLRLAGEQPQLLEVLELDRGRAPSRASVPIPAIEGRGSVIVEIEVAGQVLSRSAINVDIVPDLAVAERDVRARLAAIDATESAANLVLYPYELARQIARGEREVERRAFADRLARSRAVLAALEQGQDIVTKATGEQDRAYRFTETGELVPYRIHVPRDWDGVESLPLIVALHGAGGDENDMLDLDDGKFGRLADRYRYIVVSPSAYRPLGGYGTPIRLPSVYGSDTQQGRAVGGPERAQLLARSEQDTLAVLELVAAEYGADRSRFYLTGHSMGGGGTWYLAHQYPELWDAIAPSAGPFFIDNYDFNRLRGMGVMMLQGSGDPPSLAADRQLAMDLLAMGIGVNYLETPSVNHGQTFGASLPSIFEFFERQKLRDKPAIPLELH